MNFKIFLNVKGNKNELSYIQTVKNLYYEFIQLVCIFSKYVFIYKHI